MTASGSKKSIKRESAFPHSEMASSRVEFQLEGAQFHDGPATRFSLCVWINTALSPVMLLPLNFKLHLGRGLAADFGKVLDR